MTRTVLYAATQAILDAMPGRFVKVEPHEPDDPSGNDHLWLSTKCDETSEGELITVGPLSGDTWDVAHDQAYKYGGWPTVWSYHGPLGAVVSELTAYLHEWDALQR